VLSHTHNNSLLIVHATGFVGHYRRSKFLEIIIAWLHFTRPCGIVSNDIAQCLTFPPFTSVSMMKLW